MSGKIKVSPEALAATFEAAYRMGEVSGYELSRGESPASAAVRREVEREDRGETGTKAEWPYTGPIVTREALRKDAEGLREKLAASDHRIAHLLQTIEDRDGLIADLRTVEKEQAGTIAALREDGNVASLQAAQHKAAQLEEEKERRDEEIGRLRQFYAQAEAAKTLDGSPAGIFIRAVSAMEEVEGAAYGMLHRINTEAVSVRRSLAGQQTGGAWVDFDPLPRLIVIASNAFGLFLHFHKAQAAEKADRNERGESISGPGVLAVPDATPTDERATFAPRVYREREDKTEMKPRTFRDWEERESTERLAEMDSTDLRLNADRV